MSVFFVVFRGLVVLLGRPKHSSLFCEGEIVGTVETRERSINDGISGRWRGRARSCIKERKPDLIGSLLLTEPNDLDDNN